MNLLELLQSITTNTKLTIKDQIYTVHSKTKYTTEEDPSTYYYKFELSGEKVLVIIPNDDLIYLGEVIPNMQYRLLSDDELEYNHETYHRTGSGHQYIVEIEFGNPSGVEGKCEFEDFESDIHVISLGILEHNKRADILADILSIDDVKITQ